MSLMLSLLPVGVGGQESVTVLCVDHMVRWRRAAF